MPRLTLKIKPAELQALQARADAAGLTLPAYHRLLLGLPPAKIGRPRKPQPKTP